MANFSMPGQPSPRALYEQKYKASRMNLLLVVAFTAINLVLLITNANSYFLFSAFIPYFIATLGMLMCGRFPEEYYEGVEDMVFLDNSVFVVLFIISLALTLLYLLAGIFSNKNRVGWLIFALVFFGIDTLGMLLINGISFEAILDVVFHGWVIYYLVLGINAHNKLKNLPPEEELAPIEIGEGEIVIPSENNEQKAESTPAETQNSNAIREADKNVKHRVLLETFALNKYDICYRRVKHTNELVINGKVYDEIHGVMEYPHTLKAFIDGHYIAAGYTGTHSFINIDGQNIEKKVRLF